MAADRKIFETLQIYDCYAAGRGQSALLKRARLATGKRVGQGAAVDQVPLATRWNAVGYKGSRKER